MTRTSDATLPVEQVYSLSEYNVQQRAQEEQNKLAMRYGLESARKDLAGGNLQKAISTYGRAKFKSANGAGGSGRRAANSRNWSRTSAAPRAAT